jgi:hypothetical protein
VEGRVKTKHFAFQGVSGQASVVRLHDGSLVLFNPIAFSKENMEQINQLGQVRAIISPSCDHHSGVELAHAIWPSAGLIASDKRHMGFTEAKVALIYTPNDVDKLLGELVVVSHFGNAQKELLIYDPESRTLLGPTDSVLRNPLSSPGSRTLTDVGVALGAGLFRGAETREYGCPNTMIVQALLKTEFAAFFGRLYALDVDTIVLGHGGIVHQPIEQFLKPLFSWVPYQTFRQYLKWTWANSKRNL